jgi:hypothetical protein
VEMIRAAIAPTIGIRNLNFINSLLTCPEWL